MLGPNIITDVAYQLSTPCREKKESVSCFCDTLRATGLFI